MPLKNIALIKKWLASEDIHQESRMKKKKHYGIESVDILAKCGCNSSDG